MSIYIYIFLFNFFLIYFYIGVDLPFYPLTHVFLFLFSSHLVFFSALWTLTWSTDRRDSLFLKKKSKMESKYVFRFWKIHPRWGTVLFGVTTYFFFLFYKGENQVKTKTLNDQYGKSSLRKLDSGSGDPITY